ncbi:uncharacterized protein RCC_04194 [Ramularia collo-cygni]|uniref:Uncharacterized protein n=1 Tax=Ramularia collo-cygni TaxID=112498 RepID=A0A2D3UYS1_9PEZI|nr:uncharacterized protein RCC_04194 [Ramularia collo-cygni]CZT18350.1 uncharacterized protein RCC_04194 [Ramularia collo-cygni]
MHISIHAFLAIGIAGLANAAVAASGNSVFYAAYQGQNPGNGVKGCTGGNLGTVQRGKKGDSACKTVGEGACVTLTGHQGDATKCKVVTFSDPDCKDDAETTIFGNNGDYANENFASFLARCQ